MKHKTTKYSLTFLFGLSALCLSAQENVLSAGGNATGSGGKVAYSIGQPFYVKSSGSNGSVTPGVEHAYEIQSLLNISEYEIQLYAKAYPNPTTDILYLHLGEATVSNLTYQLIDIHGKLIRVGKISSTETAIPMNTYSKGSYFLNIIDQNKTINTFKILKN